MIKKMDDWSKFRKEMETMLQSKQLTVEFYKDWSFGPNRDVYHYYCAQLALIQAVVASMPDPETQK